MGSCATLSIWWKSMFHQPRTTNVTSRKRSLHVENVQNPTIWASLFIALSFSMKAVNVPDISFLHWCGWRLPIHANDSSAQKSRKGTSMLSYIVLHMSTNEWNVVLDWVLQNIQFNGNYRYSLNFCAQPLPVTFVTQIWAHRSVCLCTWRRKYSRGQWQHYLMMNSRAYKLSNTWGQRDYDVSAAPKSCS